MSQISQIETKAICYHCGETCDDHPVIHNNLPFCCEGCKSVYQLLNENDLCTYYDLNNQPGTNVTERERVHFSALDDPDVQKDLIEYQDEKTTNVRFYIPNVHCSSCVWLLERLPVILDPVTEARVDFLNRSLHISYKTGEIELSKLAATLSSIGYMPDLELGKQFNSSEKSNNRRLYTQLGVAGFTFGNVMLFSLPSYFDSNLGDSLHSLFVGLSMLLTLPALFYSGSDYFKAAIASIRQRRIIMDVPIALGMSALFLYSVFDAVRLGGTGFFDSLNGLIFFLLIGKVVQQKTYDRLSFERDFKSYFPISILKLTNDGELATPIQKLERGDRILIHKGELIPCDCTLDTDLAQFDFSFVTGESRAIDKQRGDHIYAGGRLLTGSAEAIVETTVDHSYLTQLWNKDEAEQEKDSVSWSDKISPYFTFAVLFIAFTSGIYWWIFDPSKAIFAFTSVLIIACPCALAMSLPFVNNAILNLMSQEGLFLKSGNVIQRLTEIKSVFVDKTGTLTLPSQADVEFHGIKLENNISGLITEMTKKSIHPLSRSIHRALEQKVDQLPLTHFDELDGMGLVGGNNDADILLGSAHLMNQFGVSIPENIREKSIDGSVVYVAVDHEYQGYFQLRPVYRPGIDEAFKAIKDFGLQLFLISGDHNASEEHFKQHHPWFDKLLYGKHPHQKMDQISKIQSTGEKTMMIGDGLNDAGALKQAHVGIAVTDDILGFTPASDGILNAGQLSKFHKLLLLARRAKFLVFASYTLSFIYNVVGIWFAAQGLLSPVISAILMPLSSISVIVFTTLSSRATAKYTLG